jgi:hypothetical protein
MKAFVIVLTTNQDVTADIARFFYELGSAGGYEVGVINGIKGYANARNTAVKMFRKSVAEYLWFIDQDMTLPWNVLDLPTIGGDIIGAAYPGLKRDRSGVPELMTCAKNYDDLNNLDSASVPELDGAATLVDCVGMGCTMIHRRVLEDKRMCGPNRYIRQDGKKMKVASEEPSALFWDATKPYGESIMGEDYEFCWRARKLGYTVKLHDGVRCGHLKRIDIRDFEDMSSELVRLRMRKGLVRV